MKYTKALSLLAVSTLFTLATAQAQTGLACVTGGPAALVGTARECCLIIGSDWFETNDFQGICIFETTSQDRYNECVQHFGSGYTPTCIACDVSVNCGLTNGTSIPGN